ncbi:COMM domain-containing protein 8-like [Palaemon carinicauda]|uniref:COMM domain-containing protein 8-like n=1 Tax=Palaemon carinicauda TaxID=392227 RepID=UPI0035B5E363
MDADNFALLATLPNSDILKFVYHAVDNICGGVPVSHNDYSQCPLDKFWITIQNVKDLATKIALQKISKEQTVLLLHRLSKDIAEEIYDAIESRRTEIKKSLVSNSIKDLLHLRDFDWNVKLAVASDKVLDLNEGLVTLHLRTSTTELENDVRNISVEMSAAQVDKLLEKLKEAQQTMVQFQDR